ncbi:MAG: patatin-like phospholipase family protein [Gammaproteobacteria bacterium]
MKTYGFVASGGGYRSFYTAGTLIWLKKNHIPVHHIVSTSSGNNIVLDYLLWDWEREELPPILTQIFRGNLKDIFNVFANFSGLRPTLIPTGSHLFTVDKQRCRRSLLLDDPRRQQHLHEHLGSLRWDIMTTNVSKRQSHYFNINEIMNEINGESIDAFLEVFLAGLTTIPYFKAIKIQNEYYLEGGYSNNTPLRSLFENPVVDEIIAVDFSDYNYHDEIDKIYSNHPFAFLLNSIEMNFLVNDLQLSLPNIKVLSRATLINRLLETAGKRAMEIDGKHYYFKPLRVLRPKNLESMTVSPEHMSIPKDYFFLAQQEAANLFTEKETAYGLKRLPE